MEDKIKVLIIDEDRSNRELYGQILKTSANLHLDEAENSEAGLKKIKRSIPDIILCDLHMPGIKGLELCRTIKSDPKLNSIYLIMISSEDNEDYKVKCINEGADDFLTKPVNPDELLARINFSVI